MYSGPAGFYKTPVTKVFLGLVAAASLLSISSPRLRHQWTLSRQSVAVELQLWSLLPAAVAFQSLPELLFGLYLIYFFRLFERQLGSRKYSVLILFSSLGSMVLQTVLLFLCPASATHSDLVALPEADAPPSPESAASWLSLLALQSPGPYGLIFALFVLYTRDVPPTARFTVFSRLHFTDKSLLYVAGLQLLLSSGASSLVPGLCGVAAGLLYYANAFGVRSAQMPAPVVQLASQYLSFVQSPPPEAPGAPSSQVASGGGARRGQRAPQRGQAAAGGTGDPAATLLAAWQQGLGGTLAPGVPGAPAPLAPPPSEAVEQLLAMGFDRESAMQALAQARNDLTLATNILLESQHLR